ncbi:Oidioi.mRNA.OKI2018_I69.XSR.g16801.t1.cds [Oikopleura dioica]|uniref:Oidioi.mRNA.OKI2018_I69.XSR.g16801.t1.cds n=1 Tax=Oikopleura dioica TaxID=34765 RepID=A0ABN7SM16_OIKDI|nr:Oidioi.mRNA.OKI2018_I69.XSR.g16801.t1.cds [Oikopleura dioica]
MRKAENIRNVETFRRQSAIRQAKMSKELSDEFSIANMCESCSELFVEVLNCCFACLTCQNARKDSGEESRIHLEDKERNIRRMSGSNIRDSIPIQEEIFRRRRSSLAPLLATPSKEKKRPSRKSKVNYEDEIEDPKNNMYSDEERKVIVFHPHSFPEVTWDPKKQPRRSSLAVSSERKQTRRTTIHHHRNSVFVAPVEEEDTPPPEVMMSTYETNSKGILKNISVQPEINKEDSTAHPEDSACEGESSSLQEIEETPALAESCSIEDES